MLNYDVDMYSNCSSIHGKDIESKRLTLVMYSLNIYIHKLLFLDCF